MATYKLMLNKARQLKDGTYPLVIQILHLRKKRVIYSGTHLFPNEFDEATQQFVISSIHFRRQTDIKKKKLIINNYKQRMQDIINRLDYIGTPYTCELLANLFKMGDGEGSLVNYWQGRINSQRIAGKFGIANAHQNTLRSVIRFTNSEHISLSCITHQFILNYERHLQDNKLSPNTICYYMRNLKTIINSLVKEGYSELNIKLLFEGIKTTPRRTIKRAISREELRALSRMELSDEPLLQFARDLFMFSFYTRGMAFVDIAFLQRKNLSGNTLSYYRQKTGQFLQISINTPIQDIISRYKNVSQYLFPIAYSDDGETSYKEYRSWLRRINRALTIIGKRLEIATPLTTYVARHSWATQAKEKGFPISVISEGLGHSTENITQIYLKEFDRSVLDMANNIITNL